MNGPLQPLLDLLNRLPDEFRDIRLEVESAVRVLELAPSLAVVAPRKVLDLIIRDVYQRCVNEPAATRPLEGLTQQLVKKGHFPTELEGYASLIRQHGNVGAHRAGVALTPTIAQDCLRALVPLLEWYVALRAPGPNPLVDPPARPPTHARPVSRMAIVPKGLRAFDAGDADFFLDLLPGPRDGGGLPESIRFWKRRIEEPDEQGFGVGVIYGPSGCGKTSLVKAGLVPQLAHHVVCVYIEATADETENRLLRGLHKKFLRLAKDRGLPETLLALRKGRG